MWDGDDGNTYRSRSGTDTGSSRLQWRSSVEAANDGQLALPSENPRRPLINCDAVDNNAEMGLTSHSPRDDDTAAGDNNEPSAGSTNEPSHSGASGAVHAMIRTFVHQLFTHQRNGQRDTPPVIGDGNSQTRVMNLAVVVNPYVSASSASSSPINTSPIPDILPLLTGVDRQQTGPSWSSFSPCSAVSPSSSEAPVVVLSPTQVSPAPEGYNTRRLVELTETNALAAVQNRSSKFASPRACFICLEEEDPRYAAPTVAAAYCPSSDNFDVNTTPAAAAAQRRRHRKELVSCCTQCFAVVHRKCWREWRRNQRLAMLRARLLAYNQPDPFSCSICKTGTAHVQDEEECFQWTCNVPLQQRLQNELFSVIGRMLNDDDDDEEPPYCTPITSCISLALLTMVGVLDLYLIGGLELYPGDVLLLSLLGCYFLAIMQFVVLAIRQRNRALGLLRERPEDEGSDSSSVAGSFSGVEAPQQPLTESV